MNFEIPLIFGAVIIALVTIANGGLHHWWGYALLGVSAVMAIAWAWMAFWRGK